MSLLWWGTRAAECAVGVAADTLGRPFLDPGRLGRAAAADRGSAWIHAASLGEATAALPLVRALRAAAPRHPLYLTASTRGGLARLRAGAPEVPSGHAPLDAPWIAGRFLTRLAPRLALLVETELWPHWLLALRRRGVPTAVVSARLSDRSVSGYGRLGPAFRGLLAELAAVCAQDAAEAERWVAAGAAPERTEVTGNLKVDALEVGIPDRAAARRGLRLFEATPLLVLASVRPGEAAVMARAWRALPEALRASWSVAIIPRHPAAASTLATEVRGAGPSLEGAGAGIPLGDRWRLHAELGVMADYYAAADLAVVGGSFAPYGGHNPLEPAARGLPVVMGPHHGSQRAAVAALRAVGALAVAEDADALRAELQRWMLDAAARARAGQAALAAVASLQGVARRTVSALAARGLWTAP